jgi:hypothetical protein
MDKRKNTGIIEGDQSDREHRQMVEALEDRVTVYFIGYPDPPFDDYPNVEAVLEGTVCEIQSKLGCHGYIIQKKSGRKTSLLRYSNIYFDEIGALKEVRTRMTLIIHQCTNRLLQIEEKLGLTGGGK